MAHTDTLALDTKPECRSSPSGILHVKLCIMQIVHTHRTALVPRPWSLVLGPLAIYPSGIELWDLPGLGTTAQLSSAPDSRIAGRTCHNTQAGGSLGDEEEELQDPGFCVLVRSPINPTYTIHSIATKWHDVCIRKQARV